MTGALPTRGYLEAENTRNAATPSEADLEPARIAVYTERHLPPRVIRVPVARPGDDGVASLIEELASHTHTLAREQGGRLPFDVLRELVENLVHASFSEVVITILDNGNTVRISDRGPGIPDKQAALRAGFTSADTHSKHFIRGVGSGLALVDQAMRAMDGVLEIEDNLGKGTVVTVRVGPQAPSPLASTSLPAYNLAESQVTGERQLKALLLTVELAPVGPTRIARELGVSTSTAYRDLVSLEEAGLVVSRATGHRSVTEAGLAYLNTLL